MLVLEVRSCVVRTGINPISKEIVLSIPEISPSENSKRLCCLRQSTRLPEYAPEVRAELTTYSVYPLEVEWHTGWDLVRFSRFLTRNPGNVGESIRNIIRQDSGLFSAFFHTAAEGGEVSFYKVVQFY